MSRTQEWCFGVICGGVLGLFVYAWYQTHWVPCIDRHSWVYCVIEQASDE